MIKVDNYVLVMEDNDEHYSLFLRQLKKFGVSTDAIERASFIPDVTRILHERRAAPAIAVIEVASGRRREFDGARVVRSLSDRGIDCIILSSFREPGYNGTAYDLDVGVHIRSNCPGITELPWYDKAKSLENTAKHAAATLGVLIQ